MQPNVLVVEDEPINQEGWSKPWPKKAMGDGLLFRERKQGGFWVWIGVRRHSSRSHDAGHGRIKILRREVREGNGHIPVIMQTAMTADADVAEGLRAGAFITLSNRFPPIPYWPSSVRRWRIVANMRKLLREAKRIGQSFRAVSPRPSLLSGL